jgi:hypothetical protein
MVGMDLARSAAARDRAERHVFEALPELDAVPRRVLALATLTEVPRAGIASEVGLGGRELSAALAHARKALRRSRSELGSGGRCERAERALSDRLDSAPAPLEERFLDAHLARCARCRTHEAELAAAVQDLRAGFAAAPEPVAPPAEESEPARGRLRVVPPAPLLPRAPEPPALEPAALEPAPAAARLPTLVEEPEPVVAEIQRPTPPTHQRIRAALPVAVAVLIAVGLVAAAIALLSAFGGTDKNARAPWDRPGAPVVHPAPISGQ